MSGEEYDLTGINGAEIYRTLGAGVRVKLSDGALCEILANPGDGAYLLVKYLEDAENPARVGEEGVCYFTEVTGAYLPAGSAQ